LHCVPEMSWFYDISGTQCNSHPRNVRIWSVVSNCRWTTTILDITISSEFIWTTGINLSDPFQHHCQFLSQFQRCSCFFLSILGILFWSPHLYCSQDSCSLLMTSCTPSSDTCIIQPLTRDIDHDGIHGCPSISKDCIRACASINLEASDPKDRVGMIDSGCNDIVFRHDQTWDKNVSTSIQGNHSGLWSVFRISHWRIVYSDSRSTIYWPSG
jgi:hypothetical protein